MTMPEITVAITTHNLESYVAPCLEELLGQTCQDFEILVYDDCSTDRSREILADYQSRYPQKIQVLLGEQPMGSPARSRNAVLNSGCIHGEYLIFLDGDDSIQPDFLEKLHTAASQSGAEIAVCAYDRFENETGHVLCQEMRGFPAELTLPPDNDQLAFVNGSLWNKLIRVSLIGETRIPDFKVGEDLSFQLALFARCHKIAFVDEVLIHYRVRAGSIISNTQEETIYAFAGQLQSLWEGTEQPWFKDTVALAAFIHIGISMTSRAYDNPDIQQKEMIQWASNYFCTVFHWFRGNPWLKGASLARHGVKGLGIWAALLCYHLHAFPLFLTAYKTMMRLFHTDIKF